MIEVKKTLSMLNDYEIYESLSQILSVNKSKILNYTRKKRFELKNLEVDKILIKEFLEHIYDEENINLNSCKNNIIFDNVTLAHLTSRINEESIKNMPLMGLHNALTGNTELSSFLEMYGFKFKKMNSAKVKTIYKGNEVDWSKYFDGIYRPYARMVSNRLTGSDIAGTDKCVNGFLFNGEIYKNHNVDHLARCPEIVQHICKVLQVEKISYEFADKSKTYIVNYKADIKDIIFDKKCYFKGGSKLNNMQKVYRIYKYILKYLAIKPIGLWNENLNPIIRLKDNLNVSKENIIEYHEVIFN